MPTLPALQILYRRDGDILFGWNKEAGIKYYKIYSCATFGGVYTLVASDIPNVEDKTIYRGKVIHPVKDSSIPIPPLVRYYFKLTYIDTSDIESDINLSPATTVFPAGVEWFHENEDEVKNNHNMAWVEVRQRWEKVELTPDGKLKVDATVNIDEITLGNVKVAARPDGTTLEYILVDNNRKLIVRPDPESISRIADVEESTGIVKNVETTVLTYSNVTAYFVEKIACSGSSDFIYKMKIDGTTNQVKRSSWNNRNPVFDFSTIARRIPGSATLTITATHKEKANQECEINLTGYTFTI